MKKYFLIILAIAFIFSIVLPGCEKKKETPKPAAQPIVTPVAPAPEPVAAPEPPAPAPAPAPAPYKPAKK